MQRTSLVGGLLLCLGLACGGPSGSDRYAPPGFAVGGDAAPTETGALALLPGDRVFSYTQGSTMLWNAHDGTWRSLPSPPTKLSGAVAVSVDGETILLVGMEGAWLLDLDAAAWTKTEGLGRFSVWLHFEVLTDGSILALGGKDCAGGVAVGGWRLAGGTTQWTALPGTTVERVQPAVVRLRDGRFLLTGGTDACGEYGPPTRSSAIFDPRDDSWTTGPDILGERRLHAGVLLDDGSVLLFGGPGAKPSAERIDVDLGTSRPTDYKGPNADFALTRRADGAWVVLGGRRDVSIEQESDESLAEVWILDPGSGAFAPAAPLRIVAPYPIAVGLSDGRVVVGNFPRDASEPMLVLPAP